MHEILSPVILEGLAIPFLGTTLGAACVFFMKHELSMHVQKMLMGFAAGVMVAASVWSLLIPAMEESAHLGDFAFVPAVAGFLNSDEAEGPRSHLSKTIMMALAVTLHNIPEGMAVGVVLAGWAAGGGDISVGAALALSIGIAIQNFPEGAIVSMPLRAAGETRAKAFRLGVLSGIVEPIGGFLTILAASFVIPVLPYLLSFAAGAMLYVVVEELIPEMSAGEHTDIGVLAFAFGFTLMMALDVALG